MAATRKDASDVVASCLAPHGFPSRGGPGLSFTAEGDALFAHGYPSLRMLGGEAEDPFTVAEDALDAIDPTLRITVPRDVARMYLLGHPVGLGLFVDAKNKAKNAKRRKERAEVMRSERPIDTALLEEALSQHGVGMGDTYSWWRWPEVIFLYEAFLDTESVARVLVRHLVREATDLSRWGFAGKDPNRNNAAPHYLALTLPWLFLRLAPGVVAELRRELLGANGRETPRSYRALLRAIAGEIAPEPAFAFALALSGGDAATVDRLVDTTPCDFLWNTGRVAWLLGTARFARPLKVAGHDLVRMIDHVAPLKDPGIVRLVALIASQRAGKKVAAEWLRRHAPYARPILRDLAALDDPKEKKAAEAALALLDSETPVVVKRPTEKELEQEIATIFAAMRKKLLAAEGDAKKKAILREAHERYTEARAAAGDPIAEAYFIHRFADFDCGEWAELAALAIRAGS